MLFLCYLLILFQESFQHMNLIFIVIVNNKQLDLTLCFQCFLVGLLFIYALDWSIVDLKYYSFRCIAQ